MTVLEIIFAILLILACVFIIAVVLMQESKQGMSNVISGGSSDNYFQKNSGRTKEAKLSRATKIAAVFVFVVAVAVNLISVYWGGTDTGSSADVSGVVTDMNFDIEPEEEETETLETEAAAEDTAAEADTTTAAEEVDSTAAAE